MKNWKLSALLSNPLAIIITVAAVVFGTEVLFMVLHGLLVPMFELSDLTWGVIDAVTLSAAVAPLLYFLVLKKIRKSEERLRQINATAQDAIIVADEQARITDWNLAAQKMFQYSREEALGQPLHQLIAPPRYHADAARGFAHFEETGDGPLLGKTSEVAARRKDGSEFPIELSISAVKAQGRWHAMGIIRDITERKLAGQALRDERDFAQSIIATAQAIVLSLDTEGRIVSFNPYLENLSGWRLEEVRGKDWFSTFLPERNREATRKLFQIAIGGIRTHGNVDVLLTRDGRELQIEWYDKALQDSTGKVTGLLAIGQDVTERKQAAELLRNSETRLHTIVENLTEGLAVSALDGQLLHFNRAALDLHGFTTLDECRQHLSKFADTFELSAMDGTVLPLDQWPLARVLRGEELRDLELRIRHLQAGWKRIYSYGGTLVRDDGQPLMAILTISDITERKQAETAFTTLVGTAAANIGTAFFRETVRSLSAWLGAECVIIGELQDGNRVRALAMQLDGQAIEHYEYDLPGTPCNQLASKGYCEYPEGVCQLFPQDKDLSDMGAEAYVGSPIRDKNGKTLGVLCAISRHKIVLSPTLKGVFEVLAARAGTEIERQRAEAALRESEQKFMQLFMEVPVSMGVADKDGTVAYFNRKFTEVFGYTVDDVPTLDAWWLKAYPDETYRSRVLDNWNAAVAKAVKEGTDVESDEYNVTCKNGAERIVIIGGRPFEGGVLAIFNDITERRQAEDKLQEMLKAANQSRLVMLDVVEDQRRAEESLRQLNAELENKVLARTAQLEQARIVAEQANKAKSEFLATMSHEIRTPMNGVIGMIEVLQQSSLNTQQMEMANIVHDSAFALLTVINDILDFSKIEAGKLELESAPMSVEEVVEKSCVTLSGMASKKRVELTLFTDPAIPAAVLGDSVRLRQVLINLTNNAIKFSGGQQRQGKVSLRAVLLANTPEQILLEFRITDNGIGMDEVTLAKLFTAFTQADSSTTRTYGGTGLGLAISHQLVNIMGGAITVQSEPGKGSAFSVRLPFKLAPDVGRMSVALSAEGDCRKALCFSDLQNLSCLVVGTPESMADDLAVYLAHDGARVERVADLAAAREWIAVRPPSLCIVTIDTAGNKLPLATPLLDGLRAAASAHLPLSSSLPQAGERDAVSLREFYDKQQTRFVVIGRGQRREPRLLDADLVQVDGNVLTRKVLLKAVAVAAGRVQLVEQENLPDETEAAPVPPSREEAKRQGSLILVAEDNEINQKVILRQLALLGRTADIANNGREALELWQSGDYAVLFADLHMPEMDGYELTAAIRAAETGKPRIPIIAFTANALKGEAEHCLAIGMDDYLSKPVQLAALKAMLEKWLPVVVEAVPDVGLVSPAADVGLRSANPTYGASAPAAVDVNVLKKLVGDDEEIIRDFLHDFRLSAEKIAVELRAACASGKTAAAGALAHKLKSSARSVGALALGELCAGMEQAGKGGDTAALAALLPRFEQELASVEGFLEGY